MHAHKCNQEKLSMGMRKKSATKQAASGINNTSHVSALGCAKAVGFQQSGPLLVINREKPENVGVK